MTHLAFALWLATTRASDPDLTQCCRFPDDLMPASVTPTDIPAARCGESDAIPRNTHPPAQAFVAARLLAHWCESCRDTEIGADFSALRPPCPGARAPDPFSPATTRATGALGPRISIGMLYAPDAPCPGVTPNFDSLDEPVARYA